jgi:hypothetical protein
MVAIALSSEVAGWFTLRVLVNNDVSGPAIARREVGHGEVSRNRVDGTADREISPIVQRRNRGAAAVRVFEDVAAAGICDENVAAPIDAFAGRVGEAGKSLHELPSRVREHVNIARFGVGDVEKIAAPLGDRRLRERRLR